VREHGKGSSAKRGSCFQERHILCPASRGALGGVHLLSSIVCVLAIWREHKLQGAHLALRDGRNNLQATRMRFYGRAHAVLRRTPAPAFLRCFSSNSLQVRYTHVSPPGAQSRRVIPAGSRHDFHSTFRTHLLRLLECTIVSTFLFVMARLDGATTKPRTHMHTRNGVVCMQV
jgi:hypothetical protein